MGAEAAEALRPAQDAHVCGGQLASLPHLSASSSVPAIVFTAQCLLPLQLQRLLRRTHRTCPPAPR